ncbi:hypothetical protein [Actinopolymorpha pittospori]|uniref:Uncharacterized protein n=1 Tax=Actinopolymorpha pittospori TaxID=648752 RepID=A0A927MZR9_9ACTN|nr:hypothetical protein [Actinopolymorpha pittospori]MBE1609965.1 hypothetical protein [Actinopolymorpha pittospori]
MTPPIERLVRLMVLLPCNVKHPLWVSVRADGADLGEVFNIRWFVGQAATMWPPAGPRNLAAAVLIAFDAPSDKTLCLISEAILRETTGQQDGWGPQAGAAWVAQATAAAVEVFAHDRQLDKVLNEVQEHWTLST